MFDVTTRSTLARTYAQMSSREAGAVANKADEEKLTKYGDLMSNYLVHAIAFETMGPASDKTVCLLKEIWRRIAAVTGDRRSGDFLIQRLSLAVQRGNAASVFGSMPPSMASIPH